MTPTNKRRTACARAGAALRKLMGPVQVARYKRQEAARTAMLASMPTDYCPICSGTGRLQGRPCSNCGGHGTQV